MELSRNHLLIPFLWVLWCTFHSTLVAATVTGYMKKKLGDHFRFYRLYYNTFSLVTLVPLLYYSFFIQKAPIFHWEGYLLIMKYLLLITSIYLFIDGGRHYNLSQLFGIQQIKAGRANGAPSEYDPFDTSGILGMIRHPWYLAGILIVWARDLSLSAFLSNIVTSTYFVIGTILEERFHVHPL